MNKSFVTPMIRTSAAPGSLAASSASPQVVTHKNGMKSVELGQSAHSHSVATRQADGSIATVCVTGADSAEHALAKALAAPKE